MHIIKLEVHAEQGESVSTGFLWLDRCKARIISPFPCFQLKGRERGTSGAAGQRRAGKEKGIGGGLGPALLSTAATQMLNVGNMLCAHRAFDSPACTQNSSCCMRICALVWGPLVQPSLVLQLLTQHCGDRQAKPYLVNTCKDSRFDLFKEPVYESQFPDYRDVVTTPMDMATMLGVWGGVGCCARVCARAWVGQQPCASCLAHACVHALTSTHCSMSPESITLLL